MMPLCQLRGAAAKGETVVSSENDDRPGVIAPPPVIFAAAALIGVGLEYLWRSSFGAALWPFCAILIALGVAGIGFAFHLFRRTGKDPDPYRPNEELVGRGLFRFTRNPFYVGLGMIQAGLAFVFDRRWVLVMAAPAYVVMHDGVVVREEAYLKRRFGDDYRAYKATVRRWQLSGADPA